MLIRDIKPPFARQGNKYALRDTIIPLIPPHKRYVELFAGSGSIFYNKEKAEENILNDLDKATIQNYKLIKKAPTNLELYRQDLDTIPKLKEFYDNHTNSITDQFLNAHIVTNNGYSGKVVKSSNMIFKPYNPFKIVQKLPEYKELLKGVTLTNKDYETIVKKYDDKHTFFFIDPHYENTEVGFGYAETKDFDFERLASVLRNIKGNFLLTINDSPNTRNLFAEFIIKPVKVISQWNKTTRKELIITNYFLKRN
jgi:DNA adenine methylase